MIIKQTRIRNLNKLNFVQGGSVIRVGISDVSRFLDKLQEIGFNPTINIGDTVLPKAIGAVTKRNSEGFFIKQKDKEKETRYRMVEWTYKQWAGRGRTIDVTESTQVPYKRYPRIIFPPYSMELMVISNDDELMIVSKAIEFTKKNKDLILHSINLFLEIFGECQILDLNNDSLIIPEVIKLNWDVLPKGRMPWEQRYKQVSEFIDRAEGNNKEVVKKRLETINKYNPDFTAIGNAGFNGYIVHGFMNKNIYILESIYTNNATYILEENWEKISKLTKAEILDKNLHKDRIIHSANWYSKIKTILGEIESVSTVHG